MVRVSLPCGMIIIAGLVAPSGPAAATSPRKQLQEWPGRTRLDNLVLLVRLARMLALSRRQQIHLPASRGKCAGVLAAHAEQNQLGHVAEIEADTTTVRAAVLADFVPDDVG